MFFYSEQDAVLTPTIILNNFSAKLYGGQSTILDLSGAQADDLLLVYSHRSDIHPFNVPVNIVSSSAGSNWYNLADSKYGSVSFYRGGSYLTYYYNCLASNNGTVASTYTGQTNVVMKKLTSSELSGQVKVSCWPYGVTSYMVIRNVNNFDMHRDQSNTVLATTLSPYYGSTTVNWQITNTNINSNTQKLFICGLRGSGTESIAGVSDISKNGGISKLFEINKEQLTGSSIPIVCTRTSYEVNNAAAYAAFIGIVIS